ncbi:MAG TPA: hypothetical protein VGW78_01270 [Candidatus Babeliales bacterium]|nr:hypothetical protein [Candidatus Babeliales bacterium]
MSFLYAGTLQTPQPFEAYFRNELNAHTKSVTADWQIRTLIGGYSRHAKSAFANRCDHMGHNSGALAALFFNKANFTMAQALGTNIPFPTLNPFLNSLVSPRIKYTDSGGTIMLLAEKQMCDDCSIGFRTQLPFKTIKVKKTCSPGPGSSILGGETINDVTVFREETVDGATVNSFAFRLDFLSELPADCALPGLAVPFVNYHNPSFPGLPITISNLDVTDNSNLNNLPLGPDNRNAVTVLQSDGVPAGTLGVNQAIVQTLPALSGDGSSLTPHGRARFLFANNYTPLGLDTQEQSDMWIVPTVDVANDELVSRARIIETQVKRLLGCIQTSPEAFFCACAGDSFANQTESGIGDLDIDTFIRYYPCDDMQLLLEGFIGFRFPTAQSTNPRAIFALPLGNNGHAEVKVGTHARWQPSDWFVANIDLLYAKVCSAQKKVAAPFRGSVVKNLGPLLCANVGWNYTQGHADATWYLVRTRCINSYFHLGYELYYKAQDHICFNQFFARDCFGVRQPLNPCLLTRRTKQLSHKVYGDLALEWQPAQWVKTILFGGFNTVVSGNNVPKEHGFQIAVQLLMEF